MSATKSGGSHEQESKEYLGAHFGYDNDEIILRKGKQSEHQETIRGARQSESGTMF